MLIYKEIKYRCSSKIIIDILELLQAGFNLDQISEKLNIDKNYLLNLKENYIDKLFIEKKRKNFLFLKIKIVNKEQIKKISNFLKIFFKKNIFIFSLILDLIFLIMYFYISIRRNIISYDINNILKMLDIYKIIVIYLLLNIKNIFHELGHVSALKYYNYDCKEVGFGVYLTFIVFYANVDESWLLKRKERVIVDIGGVFFELFYINFLTICFFIFNKLPFSNIFLITIFLTLINIFSNLFPFFKFDGYWIVSDLFGISDLQNQIFLFFKNLILKLQRKRIKKLSLLEKLRGKDKLILILYLILFIPAILYLFYIIFRFFIGFIKEIEFIKSNFLNLPLSEYLKLVILIFIIIGICNFIYKMIFNFIKNKNRQGEENV